MDATSAYWDPKAETMSRDELEALQLRRLQWQVRRCYEGSAFYRERFRSASLEPGDVKSLDDLAKLPVLTKEQLRREQEEHPPFGRYVVAPRESWRELHPSTGTTGVPVNTIWSERDCELITDLTARTLWSFGTRPGDILQNAFSYGLWVAGLAPHYAAKRIGCFVIPIGAAMTNRQMDYLINPGATVMLATPSFALHIAEALRERGVDPRDIPLRRGCFGGEGGTEVEATRQRIEAGLGIDAYDYYGLAEIGPTWASECTAKAGLHWAEDHHIVELVNPATMERCQPGEVGVLVMTHLTREATPMIRYWSNDCATLDTTPCVCGRTMARSPGGILGRADDLIIYRGAKFYPVQVEKVVRGFAALSDEFRIELETDERTGVDTCTVVVESAGGEEAGAGLLERLRARLREELLVTPQVRLVPGGTLERTMFKAKRIVDRRRR